jgi:hypothetical protein
VGSVGVDGVGVLVIDKRGGVQVGFVVADGGEHPDGDALEQGAYPGVVGDGAVAAAGGGRGHRLSPLGGKSNCPSIAARSETVDRFNPPRGLAAPGTKYARYMVFRLGRFNPPRGLTAPGTLYQAVVQYDAVVSIPQED